MTDTPPEPLTQFQEGAAQLHECYQAYTRAGFAAHEALYLVGVILAAGLRQRPEEP